MSVLILEICVPTSSLLPDVTKEYSISPRESIATHSTSEVEVRVTGTMFCCRDTPLFPSTVSGGTTNMWCCSIEWIIRSHSQTKRIEHINLRLSVVFTFITLYMHHMWPVASHMMFIS